jgi:hypothetical protein
MYGFGWNRPQKSGAHAMFRIRLAINETRYNIWSGS